MSANASDRRRPNVIFILSDDQGPWAAGCYGNNEIRTPNIDRLAATGTRFANFFCTTPVCSPSRATFLTGRIPSQHNIHEWVHPDHNMGPGAVEYLRDEIAYTDILAAHGYHCGLSGKWHLGDSIRPQHGFDFWYAHQQGGGPYNDAPMIRDGKPINDPGYVTDLITDEALGYIDRHRDDSFYLSVHYTAPHSPWIGQHPQEIVASYDDCPFESCPQEPRHPWAIALTDHNLGNREALKGYFAAVTAMDLGIGRIIDRIEALGRRADTLICFFSDNGFSCGHHGFWGKGNGTWPRNLYENSVRVPGIISQPGAIPVGVCDALVSAYDFMPTLLDYLDYEIPVQQNLPGRSIMPILRGERAQLSESVCVFDEYGEVRMIRTEEWKYVYRHAHGPDDLFHLAEDPEERVNLAADPGYQEMRRELLGMLDEWFGRYVIPERDGLRERSEEASRADNWVRLHGGEQR